MHIQLQHQGQIYTADLAKGISLASPLGDPQRELRAWSASPVTLQPVRQGAWIGSVAAGAAVNFFDVCLNPHGNGTHTESVGHISSQRENLHIRLESYHFICRLFKLKPRKQGNKSEVKLADLQKKWTKEKLEAVILQTGNYREGHDFTGENPPYFEPQLMAFLREEGVQHFLTDLPSVDPEEDGGALLAHRAFWHYPENTRREASISEMLLIPSNLREGLYLLNLQIPAFVNDAAPSRPVIYPLVPQN